MKLIHQLMRLLSDLKKRYLGDFTIAISWQYIISTGGTLFAALHTLLIVHLLDPISFGVMALAVAWASVIFQMFEFRLHEAVINYLTRFLELGEDLKAIAVLKFFILLDMATAALAMTVYLVCAFFTNFFITPHAELNSIILWSGLSILSANISNATSIGILRVTNEYRIQALVINSTGLLKLVLTAVVGILFPLKIVPILLVATFCNAGSGIVLLIIGLNRLSVRVTNRFREAPIGVLQPHSSEIRSFLFQSYLLSISSLPSKELDTGILGCFTAPTDVGMYKLAKNFASILVGLFDPVLLVLYPQLLKLVAAGDYLAAKSLIRKVRFLGWLAGGVVCGLAVIFAPLLVQILLGPNFSEVTLLFRIMIFGVFVFPPLIWIFPLYVATGHIKLWVRACILTSILQLFLCTVLGFILGSIGAALAYSLSAVIWAMVAIKMGHRNGFLKEYTGTGR